MSKQHYADSDYLSTNRPKGLPNATADDHAVAWRQAKYAVTKEDAFTLAELNALCAAPNDLIYARYEVNSGNFTAVSGAVRELLDLSGNGRHLRQDASPSNRPTINTTAFPGGTDTDTNGLVFNSSLQHYLRSEQATSGTVILQDLPTYSLAAIAVVTRIGLGGGALIAPLFSWVDAARTDANSSWSFRAQNGGATPANSTTSIQIQGAINGVGPQYPGGNNQTGPHGCGIIFPSWATTSEPRNQPFRQSWHYPPQPTGSSNAGSFGTFPSFPLTTKALFMGVSRVGSANVFADCQLKALIVVNLNSAQAVIEGRGDCQNFVRRISAHYTFYNSWGQKFNPNT